MDNFLYFNNLFNIYKDLLTEKNKNIFSYYYEDNLSLQEIADNLNVSKSYVGTTLKKCENKLQEYENKLQIYAKNDQLNKLLTYNDITKIKEELRKIIF